MAALLSFLIHIYQRVMRPVMPPMCRFWPTCSDYALEAVRVHGAAHGSLLAVKRICRCHPFNPGGIDPVPPQKGALSTTNAPPNAITNAPTNAITNTTTSAPTNAITNAITNATTSASTDAIMSAMKTANKESA